MDIIQKYCQQKSVSYSGDIHICLFLHWLSLPSETLSIDEYFRVSREYAKFRYDALASPACQHILLLYTLLYLVSSKHLEAAFSFLEVASFQYFDEMEWMRFLIGLNADMKEALKGKLMTRVDTRQRLLLAHKLLKADLIFIPSESLHIHDQEGGRLKKSSPGARKVQITSAANKDATYQSFIRNSPGPSSHRKMRVSTSPISSSPYKNEERETSKAETIAAVSTRFEQEKRWVSPLKARLPFPPAIGAKPTKYYSDLSFTRQLVAAPQTNK